MWNMRKMIQILKQPTIIFLLFYSFWVLFMAGGKTIKDDISKACYHFINTPNVCKCRLSNLILLRLKLPAQRWPFSILMLTSLSSPGSCPFPLWECCRFIQLDDRLCPVQKLDDRLCPVQKLDYRLCPVQSWLIDCVLYKVRW